MKKFGSCLAVLALILAFAVATRAQPGRMGRGGKDFSFWNSSRIVEELELTEEQIDRLEEIEYRFRKDSIDPRSRAEEARIEFDYLLSRNSTSPDQLQDLVEILSKATARLEELGLKKRISIREVLTDEQWEELVSARRRIGRKMREGFRRMGRSRSGSGRGMRRLEREGDSEEE